jgi:hypothetical protein
LHDPAGHRWRLKLQVRRLPNQQLPADLQHALPSQDHLHHLLPLLLRLVRLPLLLL